jgi:hypothetical protein
MGKITRERVSALEEYGEDAVFERILAGETVRSIVLGGNIGWRAFYSWLRRVDGREARYKDILHQAAHAIAARAVDTAQTATPETVNVARLQVDTDKWYASKLNPAYDIRQKDVTVTLRVEDLHAQAAALISSEVEREIVEGEFREIDGEPSQGGAGGEDDLG